MDYVFVTGATGVLGTEFVLSMLKSGKTKFFLTGRNEEKLILLKQRLLSLNENVLVDYYPCDLSNEISRKKMFDYILNKGYKFSYLLNVAGVDTQKSFQSYTESKIIFQSRVNFEGAISVTKFCLDNKAKTLKILTVASISGVLPMPYFAIYSATKCAEINFFTALLEEVKNEGVKITIAIPGGIPTREDIILDIKRQGITGRLSSKPKQFVVKKCLKALEKGRKKVIPGVFNKFVYYLNKITPNFIKLPYVSYKWKRKEKDAF